MRNKFSYPNLFTFSEAKEATVFDKIVLLSLVIAGCISILSFADWWFRSVHITNFWMYIVLSFCLWYSIIRLILIWINYLKITKPKAVPAPPNLKVALFTTSSPGEPLEMFEKTLEACKKL